jgi:methyl-accepting chemotaxis protein
MFTAISKLRIFPRLLILFTALIVIASISMVVLGTFYINTEQTHAQAVQASFNAQQIASSGQTNLQYMNEALQARFSQVFASAGDNTALGNDPSLAASGGLTSNDIVANEAAFNETLQTYNSTYNISSSADMKTIRSILNSDATHKPLIAQQQTALNNVINSQWNAYRASQDSVLTQLSSPTPQYETAYATLYQADLQFQNLKESWLTVVNVATTVGQAVTNLTNSEVLPLQIATVIAALLIIGVIVLTGFIVNSTISRPLRYLAALTRRIARGEVNERASVDGQDEIYVVASSMNNMLDHIVQLIQEAETRHVTLQRQVEKLISEVRDAGSGDLRVQAEASSDSLGVLASFINYMISELGSLVINFKTLANEVERATIQTFDDMSQIVETADGQIQSITSATTNVEEMASGSRLVAQRVQELVQVGNRVYTTTRSGRDAVFHTVEGMEKIRDNVHLSASKVQELADHSQEINNIVRIIAGIAHQTNRLALDASIQAAMAGENGKAFRAVADDIRRASETAKVQASLIERIVNRVFEDIQEVSNTIQSTEVEAAAGTRYSQEAGTAFEAIFSALSEQTQEIEMIHQAAMRQLQVSGNVVQIMQATSGSTIQSNQRLREESKRMERVAELAEQLLASAEVFKLRDDQDIFAAPSSGNTGNVVARPEPISPTPVWNSFSGRAFPVAPSNNNSNPSQYNSF